MLVTQVARHDAGETERFEAMLASPAWEIYRAAVEAVLKSAIDRCVREADDVELRRAQGAAVAVRAVLEMPAAMLAKMRGGAK